MSQAGMAGTSGGGGGRIITAINTFNPNAVIQEFDDFLGFSGNGPSPKLAWNNGASGSPLPENGTDEHPGIVTFETSGGSSSSLFIFDEVDFPGTSLGCLVPGGGVLKISWTVKLNSLSAGGNTYRYSVGLCDYGTVANFTDTYTNGIFFHYTDSVNGGNWQLKCTSASVTTTVNTSIAADTNWHTFSFVVNAGATSVSFYIDGSVVGSAITTNIPTVGLTPMMNAVRTAGSLPTFSVDLFWVMLNLTTPRPGLAGSSVFLGTGMLILAYRQTAVSTQILNTDAIVGVSSTAAPRTLTMPNSDLITGQVWTFKDESGGAATNNITVNGNGLNIDGAATYAITTNYGAVSIYYNGSNFFII